MIRDENGNEVTLDSLRLNESQAQPKPLSPKAAAVQALAESYLGNYDASGYQADMLNQAVTVPEDQREDPSLGNAWRDNAKQAQTIQNIVDAGYGKSLGTNLSELNPSSQYKELKKATHDFAHFSSGEQGVIDWIKSGVASFERPELVEKSEAEQLAKEAGVDLKFEKDKPITRGALDYAISRQVQKKQLASKIAEYRSTGDYTTMQEILLLGSAISGGIGFLETAATVGLSVAAGAGVSAALGRAASVTNEATGILKGVQGAQRAANAVQYAQQYTNTAREAQLANDLIKLQQAQSKLKYWNARTGIRKGATFAEKLGYDAYQFGKFTGVKGTAASLPSTSAAFAVDGALGSVLPELARMAGDKATMSGEYTSKDFAVGVAAGGAFGAVMPVIGKGFQSAGKTVMETVANSANARIAEKELQAALKNNKAVVEAAEKSGLSVNEMIDNISNAIADEGNLADNELALATAIDRQNVTEDEFNIIMLNIIQDLKAGKYPNIDKLPIRNMYYSDVPKILDMVTAHASENKSPMEFIEALKASGIKFERNKKVTFDNPIKELKQSIAEGKVGSTVRIAGETKALGRFEVFGLNQRDADRALSNLYIARMGGETDSAIAAGVAMENYLQHLALVKKQIQEITGAYNIIEHANEAVNKRGAATAFDYEYQKTAYKTVADDVFGTVSEDTDLPTAIKNLSHLMLPEELRAEYQTMKEIIDRGTSEKNLVGHLIDTSQEDFDKAEMFLKKIETWEKDFAQLIYHDEQGKINKNITFHRLNVLGEESGNSQTAFLERLEREIDQGIEHNSKLYNTDRIFAEENKSPEEILQRIQDTNEISELNYVYNPENLSARQLKDLVEDSNNTKAQLDTAKLNYQTYESSPIVASIKELTEIQNNSMSQRLQRGYFYQLQESITTAEKILGDSAGTIKENFTKLMKENPYLQKIMEHEGTLDGATLLRVTSEEGHSITEMFKQAVEESIGSKFPIGSLGQEYEDIFEDALESFTTYLRQHPEDALTNLVTPHGFDAERNTAEEISKSLSESYKQSSIYDGLISEAMNHLADSVARFEIRKITEVTNFFEAWGRCLDTKGKMSESILGEITMTWLARKGSSLSVENMSNINTEYKWFLQQMDRQEIDAGERLSEWAGNQDNFVEIRDAIIDTWASVTGMLSKEEDEAFKRTIANTRAGRVAQAFLDSHTGIVRQLNLLGSNKADITRLLNSSKLSRSHSLISVNELKSNFFNNIGSWMHSTQNEQIQKALSRFCISDSLDDANKNAFQKFFNINNNKEQMRTANNAIHLFKVLDLDKHFGKGYPTRVGLNELRDALESGAPLATLIQKYGEKDINKALTKIADGILGSQTNVGLMKRLWTGSRNSIAEITSEQSKYINDINQPLHYKSIQALKDDIKDFGYDDLRGWFEASVGNGKKAYAVLRKSGINPMQFYEGLMDLAMTYANHLSPLRDGEKNALALQQSLSPEWQKRVRFAVRQVCGTTSAPMSAGMVVAQSIIRFLSTPMLMKAGLKSLSDYAYQYQYLVTTGFRSGTDLTARYDVYSKFLKSFSRDKKLLNSIYMNQQLKESMLYEMIYNEPINSGMLKKYGNLNEWAPAWMKLQEFTNRYSKTLLDGFAWIGPFTRYNRMNAALNVMESLGEFASHSFADIANIDNKRLLQTLNRFGITETEWDDILSKKTVMTMNDYITKMHSGETLGELGDNKLFFPELLIDLTDDELSTVMSKQGIPVTPESIASYKQSLVDKASMIVNVSADEMTTIPTARVQGALSLATDPNTWLGMGIRALTQFQSFGTGVNFYHWGRRLASHMDMEDPLFNKILSCAAGATTAADMATFVTELAVFQFILNEAVSGLAGTRKAVNVNDEFNTGNLSEKVIKAFVDQAGVFGPLLDAIVTGFEKGRGQGGGFSLSVLPSGSTLLGQASRLAQAATRESTADNRGQAIGGALLTNLAYYTGLPNLAYTQAGWNFFIGDKLTEWQQGTNYNRYLSNRARNGYVPSWVHSLMSNLDK